MFQISHETVTALREELAIVRAARQSLETQLVTTQANFEWIRLRVNALEIERAQLLQKAYGIHTAVPEIVRTSKDTSIDNFSFDDMGDEMAKTLGLPVYSS